MRLLNTQTLQLKSFIGNQVPDYAILSHTWDDEEITFEDIAKQSLTPGSAPDGKNGSFAKISGACHQAARYRYEWVWIDTCCIDKSSSSELQEAINSMWTWYKNAGICFAYLADVPDRATGRDNRFTRSRWFTRAWTLQELIAPDTVEFYATDWSYIGTKLLRLDDIQKITGISGTVLRTGNIKHKMAAEVLSWAAHRNASREEDLAYSLMGLFDCQMPMLYGEGERKAFLRLQEEIFKRQPDHSLVLYTWPKHSDYEPLLASSLWQFCSSKDCLHGAILRDRLGLQNWKYQELNYYSHHQSQHTGEIHREELLIRRDRQDMMLSVLDETDPEVRRYNNEHDHSGPDVKSLAVLHVADANGRHPCLVLARHTHLRNRFKRCAASIVFIDGNRPFPTPRLVHFVSDPDSLVLHKRGVEIFVFKFQANHFRATSMNVSSKERGHNSMADQKIEAITVGTWRCTIVVCGWRESSWRIRLDLGHDEKSLGRARLVAVSSSPHESPVPTIHTPPGFLSDEYELQVDEVPAVIISVRRLPTIAGSNQYLIQMNLI
jgi:hypothetical protein